jgi:hypothetical protein
LFEIKGEMLASTDALGPRLAAELASALGAEELECGAVVLPASMHPRRLPVLYPGRTFAVAGIALAAPAAGAPLVVPVHDENGAVNVAVVAASVSRSCTAANGMDPEMGLVRIDATVSTHEMDVHAGSIAHDAWAAAVVCGQWALASELIGIGRHVVAQAVRYAGERRQYGRAIGSFQAVQHRLAAAYAQVIGASDVVTEAASSPSPWIARVAKALAGRAAEDACTQAQQVYGAIGFTWEHEFHRFLRRTYVLDRLFGDWRTLEHEIGAELRSRREVPRIGAL